jgi:hypothetical protein
MGTLVNGTIAATTDAVIEPVLTVNDARSLTLMFKGNEGVVRARDLVILDALTTNVANFHRSTAN